jgi:spore coat-associated protein N
MGIKSKLGLALATTALGATLVGAGTFALFTSTTANAGNTFTSGTVAINDTTTGTLASQEINFNNLAPGDNGTLKMTVKNNGTLDVWAKIDTAASDATKTGNLFGGSTPIQLTYITDVVKLAPGTEYIFSVGYNFPLAADATYQGATGTYSIQVDAVQARNNTNSAQTGPVTWN